MQSSGVPIVAAVKRLKMFKKSGFSDTKRMLLFVARHLWTCTVDSRRLKADCAAFSTQTMSMNKWAVRPLEGKTKLFVIQKIY